MWGRPPTDLLGVPAQAAEVLQGDIFESTRRSESVWGRPPTGLLEVPAQAAEVLQGDIFESTRRAETQRVCGAGHLPASWGCQPRLRRWRSSLASSPKAGKWKGCISCSSCERLRKAPALTRTALMFSFSLYGACRDRLMEGQSSMLGGSLSVATG